MAEDSSNFIERMLELGIGLFFTKDFFKFIKRSFSTIIICCIILYIKNVS